MWQETAPEQIDQTTLFRPNQPLPFPGLNLKVPRPEEYTDFTSSDYLGLSSNPNLRTTFLNKLQKEKHILGSSSVRLLDGNTTSHTKLEHRLKSFYNSEEALLFNSGYDANLSVFSSLPSKGDFLVFDEFVHASTIDGMRLSPASRSSMFPFKHNSPQSLRDVLRKILTSSPEIRSGRGTAKIFVALETLYSMDGDFAPLFELITVCEQLLPHRSSRHIIIDEAHTIGAFGKRGKGIIHDLGLEHRVDIRVHPLSKALGNMGAVVLCNTPIFTHLVHYSRPLIFSTSLNRCSLAAIESVFDVLDSEEGDTLVRKLDKIAAYAYHALSNFITNINHPQLHLSSSPYKVSPSSLTDTPRNSNTKLDKPTPQVEKIFYSPVLPLKTPHAINLCSYLVSHGYTPKPIVYPVVRKGEERVRLCVHVFNSKEEVDSLVNVLRTWVRGFGAQARL